MKSVAFSTLGCKVNQYESDLMKQEFVSSGYNIYEFDKKADVYVINSCSVTNLATRKSRNMIKRARRLNENAIIILAGCYSEELKNTNKYSILNNDVDLIIGNEEKKDIISILESYDKNASRKKALIRIKKDISKIKKYKQINILQKGKNIRESVKIEDGCNNFCTYCIIPYTRGRVRSRSICDIEKEVTALVKNGVCEVILVGIEIASYGKDLKNDISLIDVIEAVDKIDGLKRIRLRIY